MTFEAIQHYLQRNLKGICLLLPMMYLAGIIGLQWSVSRAFFQVLSPYNLWFSLLLLLGFHQVYNRTFGLFLLLCFCTGLGIEIVGVHTGMVFGDYQYGKTLGVKVLDVPWVIGANWLLLVYSSGILISPWLVRWATAPLVKALLGGLFTGIIMTALDVLIEPVAIQLDFWTWATPHIPLQNYLAWFVIASVLGFAFQMMVTKKENRVALLLLGLQVFFFLSHTLAFRLL